MKISIRTLAVGSLAVVIAAGAIGFPLAGNSASKDYDIKLTPVNGTTELEAERKAGPPCSKNAKGCMMFDKGVTGMIKLHLQGTSKKSKTCDDPGVDKVITEIKLTTTGENNDKDALKGDFTKAPDPWLKNYAFIGVDLNDGVVFEGDATAGSSNPGRTLVWLVNMNNHDPSLGEKTFWYQVTATECNGGANPDKWITDPRGENKGM